MPSALRQPACSGPPVRGNPCDAGRSLTGWLEQTSKDAALEMAVAGRVCCRNLSGDGLPGGIRAFAACARLPLDALPPGSVQPFVFRRRCRGHAFTLRKPFRVNKSSDRDALIALSHALGDPALDAVILGEGNTSVLCDDGAFLVKASGCSLETLEARHVVRLRRVPLVAMLDGGTLSLADVQAVYLSAKVETETPERPSVEAVFHALLLGYPGIRAVAHVHPTAVNALTCSRNWPECLRGRLCPDEAVVLGPDSVFVDYQDPGVELARAIRAGVDAYCARWGQPPKVVYLQNHGVIALGASPDEAVNIVRMAIKAARLRLGALQAGGIHPLSDAVVAHLLGRSDEQYRQRILGAAPR